MARPVGAERETVRAVPFAIVATLLGASVFGYLIAYPPTLNPADESQFLYGAKRILEGQALYRDVFEFITPAGFYLFALVFAAAGTTMQAARIAMIAVHALSAVLIYALARKIAGMLEAVLAALVFAIACVPVWYQASPHWLSTSFCLATAAALLSDRWPGERSRWVATGALAGLTFANQQQRGVFLGVWVAAALLVLSWQPASTRLRRWWRALGWTAAGWMAVVGAVLGYAVWRSSVRELVAAIFTHVLYAYGGFYVGMMGWGGVGWITKWNAGFAWPWIPWLVPAVVVLEAGVLGLRLRRDRCEAGEAIAGCLLLLAAAMAGAIFYFPDIIHICFILPFSLIVAAGLVHRFRSIPVMRRGMPRAVAAIALAVAFVAVIGKAWTNLQEARAVSPARAETAFGTIAGDDKAQRTIDELRSLVPPGPAGRRRFFVYPAYAAFYLTIPGDDPTPFSLLMPGYNTPEQLRITFDALDRDPTADVIVTVPFVKADDPLVEFMRGRYEERGKVGAWKFFFVYRHR